MPASKPFRFRRLFLGAVAAIVLVVGVKAWRDTVADPQVLTAAVTLPGLPAGQHPLRLLLLSDLHVAGPDMPPARLKRIIAQANALQPDLVLLAGDFISDRRLASQHYGYREALAPLGGIRAGFGSVAVLGNHDHWRDEQVARDELTRVGVTVLANSAVQRGALVIGGLDDDFTAHADISGMVTAMRRLPGVPVVLSHSPDPFPDLPADLRLMLAGHTHCGQIRYPWGGTPATMSRYGDRYACGRIDEHGRTLVVSAGLGVSVLPFRFGTRPDMWLITLRPAPGAPARR